MVLGFAGQLFGNTTTRLQEALRLRRPMCSKPSNIRTFCGMKRRRPSRIPSFVWGFLKNQRWKWRCYNQPPAQKKLGIPSVKIWASQTQSDLGDVFVEVETKHDQNKPKSTIHLQDGLTSNSQSFTHLTSWRLVGWSDDDQTKNPSFFWGELGV